jgi:hypothetical protein
VCLTAVILVSCATVVFLLRNQPSDQDRAIRQRNRRHPHQSVPTSSAYNYSPSTAPSKPTTKLGLVSLFGDGGRGGKTGRSRHSGSRGGWVQAGSGEWDLDNDARNSKSFRVPEMDESPLRSPPIAASPLTPPRPLSRECSDSTSSAHLDFRHSASSYFPVSPISASIPVIAAYTSSSPQSSPPLSPPIPVRSSSPEIIPGSGQDDQVPSENRKESGQSRLSLWTFEGGTKFIEAL